MQIRFPKENLQKAINVLQKAAQNKISSNLPGSIYISTKNNQVELQANDFELGIKIVIDGQIIEQGTMVIGSRYFQELIRKMPGSIIELNRPEGSNKLTIKSGSSEVSLVTLNIDDFTLIEEIHDEYNVLIDADDLKNLIDFTNYASATDQDRPIFTGALFELKENTATMVATDTHRMAIKKIMLENIIKTEMRSVIPTRILSEISRLLPIDNPTMIKIIWNRTQVAFMFDNIYMVSRLIEGSYPEYEKVIPKQFDATVVLDRKELAGAVDRVSLLAKDISYNVIRYDWKNNEVILSSQNSEVGMVKENVACTLQGKEFTISFNGRYISDILKHSTSDNIHLSLKENGPVVIRQDNNPNYTYVVTPVRTN